MARWNNKDTFNKDRSEPADFDPDFLDTDTEKKDIFSDIPKTPEQISEKRGVEWRDDIHMKNINALLKQAKKLTRDSDKEHRVWMKFKYRDFRGDNRRRKWFAGYVWRTDQPFVMIKFPQYFDACFTVNVSEMARNDIVLGLYCVDIESNLLESLASWSEKHA